MHFSTLSLILVDFLHIRRRIVFVALLSKIILTFSLSFQSRLIPNQGCFTEDDPSPSKGDAWFLLAEIVRGPLQKMTPHTPMGPLQKIAPFGIRRPLKRHQYLNWVRRNSRKLYLSNHYCIVGSNSYQYVKKSNSIDPKDYRILEKE